LVKKPPTPPKNHILDNFLQKKSKKMIFFQKNSPFLEKILYHSDKDYETPLSRRKYGRKEE